MAEFKLPRLKTLDRIVDALGRPSIAFVNFFLSFTRAIEAQEAAQAEIIADLAQAQADIIAAQDDIQAQIDALAAVLAGTTPFTGLNVGGTNVKPFLDNTDGTKIDTASGLGTDVVETAAVLAGSITPAYSALTTGAVLWTAESTEKDLQSVVVTVARGTVKISAQCNVLFDSVASAATTGILRLYRDGVELFPARIALGATISQGASFIFPPQWMLAYEEAPGAGTYTYKITFEPGAVNNGQVGQRSLSAPPMQG